MANFNTSAAISFSFIRSVQSQWPQPPPLLIYCLFFLNSNCNVLFIGRSGRRSGARGGHERRVEADDRIPPKKSRSSPPAADLTASFIKSGAVTPESIFFLLANCRR